MPTSPINGHPIERESQDRYEEFRSEQNSKYRRAWQAAPKSFKRLVLKKGLKAEPDIDPREGMTLEFDENRSATSYTPDPAADIDTHIDRIIEKYGSQHAKLIREISDDLQEPMRREIEQSRGLMLGRAACYLVKGGKINVMARIHAILHTIPLLAKQLEFSSLRDSARDCGCSAQWMKKQRDTACHYFGLPIPIEAQKKPEAKIKYKHAALGIGTKANGKPYKHWRHQTAEDA